MMFHRLIASVAGCAALAFASSAGAALLVYHADLSGPNESPVNASPGTGFAVIGIDDVLNSMTVDVTFAGLLGTTTASHIHCCTTTPGAGVGGVGTSLPTFPGFPLVVTSGVYSHSFSLTDSATYNPAFVASHGLTVAAAETQLLQGIAEGRAYLNIHSTVFPGGEIRGFLQLTVPEPSSWALMILGVGLAGASLRRRRTAFA